jgi:ADP-ribosyl-[dinitrogen reductase] hydrolase
MIRGSCLCGTVAYEAETFAGPMMHCHCPTCRKAHSAAFATTARVVRAGFRWTRGEDALGGYESTPGKTRWFCSRCGSQLVAGWATSDYVILRIGCLDEGLGEARPVAHIFTADQPAWSPEFDDGLPHYPAEAAKPPEAAQKTTP